MHSVSIFPASTKTSDFCQRTLGAAPACHLRLPSIVCKWTCDCKACPVELCSRTNQNHAVKRLCAACYGLCRPAPTRTQPPSCFVLNCAEPRSCLSHPTKIFASQVMISHCFTCSLVRAWRVESHIVVAFEPVFRFLSN